MDDNVTEHRRWRCHLIVPMVGSALGLAVIVLAVTGSACASTVAVAVAGLVA